MPKAPKVVGTMAPEEILPTTRAFVRGEVARKEAFPMLARLPETTKGLAPDELPTPSIQKSRKSLLSMFGRLPYQSDRFGGFFNGMAGKTLLAP